MSLELILFIVFATVAVVSSVLMITRKNAIISALFLVLNFGALSGIYLTLHAQFIAVVQVIVYAGAIMVLFLFVIMLLRPADDKGIFDDNPKLKFLAVSIGVFIFLQIAFIILFGSNIGAIENSGSGTEIGTIQAIGKELYTTYLIPFEAAAFLLLAAAIGSIVLAKKKFN
ncbi:MAG TPA: NADH-quinone oxidoreductase subunit J [Bacteroidetes bacterium]|nr:NADH-quinone oxidoreductase subunit J [Bacteroidota bacterium]HRI47007.1 NADH-quinone oxidoreductase subunit J [Ignavibacteriaceae bacterium]